MIGSRGKSSGEPHAVQTLRTIRKRKNIAKRLDCGGFSTAFRLENQTRVERKEANQTNILMKGLKNCGLTRFN